MAERKERCETCRFWGCWDEREPVKLTPKEWLEKMEMTPETEEEYRNCLSALGAKDGEERFANFDRKGDCRRHSPTLCPEIEDEEPRIGAWPFTKTDDWCGEWQAADANFGKVKK